MRPQANDPHRPQVSALAEILDRLAEELRSIFPKVKTKELKAVAALVLPRAMLEARSLKLKGKDFADHVIKAASPTDRVEFHRRCFAALMLKYERQLVARIAHRFGGVQDWEKDEILQANRERLHRSAEIFDPSIGRRASLLRAHLRWVRSSLELCIFEGIKRRTRGAGFIVPLETRQGSDWPDLRIDPARAAFEREQLEWTMHWLPALPEAERRVISQHDLLGLSFEEIVAEPGMSRIAIYRAAAARRRTYRQGRRRLWARWRIYELRTSPDEAAVLDELRRELSQRQQWLLDVDPRKHDDVVRGQCASAYVAWLDLHRHAVLHRTPLGRARLEIAGRWMPRGEYLLTLARGEGLDDEQREKRVVAIRVLLERLELWSTYIAWQTVQPPPSEQAILEVLDLIDPPCQTVVAFMWFAGATLEEASRGLQMTYAKLSSALRDQQRKLPLPPTAEHPV